MHSIKLKKILLLLLLTTSNVSFSKIPTFENQTKNFNQINYYQNDYYQDYDDQYYYYSNDEQGYEYYDYDDDNFESCDSDNYNSNQNMPTINNEQPNNSNLNNINEQNIAILDEHNKARNEVGVSPLKWSNHLASIASNYAKTLANNCIFEHSNTNYGENLFMGTKGYYTPIDGVKAWWNEKKYYDYKKNSGHGNVVGHYTQIIWRNTREVGCGQSIGCGNIFFVCNYNPAGNIIGQRPY